MVDVHRRPGCPRRVASTASVVWAELGRVGHGMHDPEESPAHTDRAGAQAPIEIRDGDAVVPDAEEAASASDLLPEDPPGDAEATGDPDKKPAVAPPVPAHGEMASQAQLDEGDAAVEMAGGGGTDMAGTSTGEAETGRPGQGGTGQGTDESTMGSPEDTARAARRARR